MKKYWIFNMHGRKVGEFSAYPSSARNTFRHTCKRLGIEAHLCTYDLEPVLSYEETIDAADVALVKSK